MRFKDWWKKLKYWQKGGIIGFLLGLFPILLSLFVRYFQLGGIGPFISFIGILALPSIIIFFILQYFGILNETYISSIFNIGIEYGVEIPIALGYLFAPLIDLILGIFIGYIYGKIKKQ